MINEPVMVDLRVLVWSTLPLPSQRQPCWGECTFSVGILGGPARSPGSCSQKKKKGLVTQY